MKIDSVEGSYLDPLADKVLIGPVALEMAHKDLLHRNVVPDLSDWLYCKMLPSSVEQFIIELVAWAGRLSIPPPKNLLDISNVFFQWTSWYDLFHLDGTHPVKVEPLLKCKVFSPQVEWQETQVQLQHQPSKV
ncbi:hypothetical protein NC651_026030 [Populus alba x Populus x berolinensis]|nr:hypothetical protein NC651_026030 [Populus alba x Populus x berolinensis]